MPPLDPTAPASISRLPLRPSGVSGMRPIAKPILASECLKDDIAPLEPYPRTCRAVLGVAGAASIAGAAIMLPSFPTTAMGCFVGGATAAIAAALPSYRLRGAVGVLGALVVVSALVSGEHSWALRSIAAIVLAAALFTRAGYRAHRGVRVALGVGIALFAAAAATSMSARLPSKIAAGAMAFVALASLLGFMGEQTTGGTAWWAALVLLSTGASLTVGAVVVPIALVPLAAVATLFVATVAASTALFTVVASVIARGEREREHRPSIPPPSNTNE